MSLPITVPPPMTMPIWIPTGNIAELQPGALRAAKIERREVLICRVGDELFGLDNHGMDSILPLDRGVLTGYLLRDPWHHVDYDVRTGEIQDGSKLSIETYPIVIGKDGKFRIGFNISKKAAAFLAQTRRTE